MTEPTKPEPEIRIESPQFGMTHSETIAALAKAEHELSEAKREIERLKEELTDALHPEFGWVYREQNDLQSENEALRARLVPSEDFRALLQTEARLSGEYLAMREGIVEQGRDLYPEDTTRIEKEWPIAQRAIKDHEAALRTRIDELTRERDEALQVIADSTPLPEGLADLQFDPEAFDNLQAQRDRLRAFALELFACSDWPEGCTIDGFAFQDAAVKHGLLEETTQTAPCGESCSCAEYHSTEDFAAGMTCYRKTALLTADALVAEGEKDAPGDD